MKKLINNMKSKLNKAVITAKCAVTSNRGDGYIDTAVKIIIGVVIGGLLLAGLYTLFNDVVLPGLTDKINDMFSM